MRGVMNYKPIQDKLIKEAPSVAIMALQYNKDSLLTNEKSVSLGLFLHPFE